MKKNFGLFQHKSHKETSHILSVICCAVLAEVCGEFSSLKTGEIKGEIFSEIKSEVTDVRIIKFEFRLITFLITLLLLLLY